MQDHLFVQVTRGQTLRCDNPFASAGRSRGTWGGGGCRCQMALGSHGCAVMQKEMWCKCRQMLHPGHPCMQCCCSHLVG